MKTTANVENLRQYKNRYSLIVEETLTFLSGSNLVKEVKNSSSTFKRIT